MNIGSTYDGDYGNEVILGDVTIEGFTDEEICQQLSHILIQNYRQVKQLIIQ